MEDAYKNTLPRLRSDSQPSSRRIRVNHTPWEVWIRTSMVGPENNKRKVNITPMQFDILAFMLPLWWERIWNICKGLNIVAKKGETPLCVVCTTVSLTLKAAATFFWTITPSDFLPSFPQYPGFFLNTRNIFLWDTFQHWLSSLCCQPGSQAPFPLCNLAVRMCHSTYIGVKVEGIWYKKDARD